MSSIDLQRTGAVATLTLSNPGKLNAIDLSMWRALKQRMAELAAQPDVRCVVVRGAGDEAFAAGGDLEEFVTARATLEQALHYHGEVAAALQAIADFPHPTIAMIRGACVGGGLEIAAACDLRIASNNARFGAPINKLGFSMYPGEMEGLLQLVGPAVVKEILLEGRILTATISAPGPVNAVDAALHAELARVDPATAARLPPTDSQRIQRALEVWQLTGRPLSSFHTSKE